MKKEELRIGNLVEVGIDSNHKSIFGIITALGDNSTCLLSTKEGTRQMRLVDIEPILITEEWLIRLGLERKSLGKDFVWVTNHYQFLNPKVGWSYRFKADGMVSFIFGKYFVQAIRFVHQMQNFHFEMTSDILTYDLPDER